MTRIIFGALIAFGLGTQTVLAGVCDYKPSNLIGSGGAVPAASMNGAVAGAAGAGKAAGLYTWRHKPSGKKMFGSIRGGASAAKTVGFMGRTAGVGAAVMSVVLTPYVWVPAAVTAIGAGALEGGCYLAGK